jgi:hypothetical protein
MTVLRETEIVLNISVIVIPGSKSRHLIILRSVSTSLKCDVWYPIKISLMFMEAVLSFSTTLNKSRLDVSFSNMIFSSILGLTIIPKTDVPPIAFMRR